MKKAICIILLISLILSFTSCKGNEPIETVSSAPQSSFSSENSNIEKTEDIFDFSSYNPSEKDVNTAAENYKDISGYYDEDSENIYYTTSEYSSDNRHALVRIRKADGNVKIVDDTYDIYNNSKIINGNIYYYRPEDNEIYIKRYNIKNDTIDKLTMSDSRSDEEISQDKNINNLDLSRDSIFYYDNMFYIRVQQLDGNRSVALYIANMDMQIVKKVPVLFDLYSIFIYEGDIIYIENGTLFKYSLKNNVSTEIYKNKDLIRVNNIGNGLVELEFNKNSTEFVLFSLVTNKPLCKLDCAINRPEITERAFYYQDNLKIYQINYNDFSEKVIADFSEQPYKSIDLAGVYGNELKYIIYKTDGGKEIRSCNIN